MQDITHKYTWVVGWA